MTESRRKNRRNVAAASCLVASLAFAPFARAQQPDRAKVLGNKILCMCGGCEDAAGSCNHMGGSFSGPCDTAKAMLKEVNERVGRNESDDLTLQSFVQEYGATVLVEPPKSGFNWLAWIAPIAMPLFALFVLWEVARRWRQRARLAPAGGPKVSADLLARARRESARDADD
jgi:cytochrome c-type biogenesis protein CcmH/NrfF